MVLTVLRCLFLVLLASVTTLTGHAGGTSLAKNITEMSHDEMVDYYKKCKENLKNDPCAICQGMQAISVADTFSCAPVEISARYRYAYRHTVVPNLPQQPPIAEEGKVVFTVHFLGCLETKYFDVDKKEIQAYTIEAFNPGEPASVRVESVTARFRIRKGHSNGYATVQNPADVIITMGDMTSMGHKSYFTSMCEEMSQRYVMGLGFPEIRFRLENVIPAGWQLNTYGKGEWTIVSHPQIKITPNPCDWVEKGIREGEFRTVFSMGLLSKYSQMHFEDGEAEVVISFRPTPGLSVTPAEAYQATGPDKEGKYTPSEKSFTVTNKGNQPLDYFVSADQNWIYLKNAKGRLGAGQSAEVLAILDAAVLSKMDEGRKAGQIDFRNLTDSKGNTFRTVTVEKVERWRVTMDGWDTLSFGESLLSGGVKANWRVQAEFEIVDGKYRNGQGRAGFLAPEVHSNPPGVYDCQFYEGTFHDSKGNVNRTPYIAREAFPVPGQASGGSVKMEFPGNFYYLHFFCIMDTDRAKEAFGAKRFSAFTPEYRARISRKIIEQKEARPLPSGSMVMPLKDGWSRSYGRTESMDAHTITIERLK